MEKLKLKTIAKMLVTGFLFIADKASAQQYNSDSWLSKPHGTITIIPTYGQRNSMIMNTFSLFPKWEFTIAAYIYNDDGDPATDDGYSTSLYGKYMFYENEKKTGGASVKAGTGMRPGTIAAEERTKNAFKTYWVNFPCTVPFFDNRISWDLMPGTSVRKTYGTTKTYEWGVTYSTRVAYYPFNDKGSIVGEVFGTAGEAYSSPEYRIGLRWEPNVHTVFAITYGEKFNQTRGAGFEIGVMIFTPQFLCFGPCKK